MEKWQRTVLTYILPIHSSSYSHKDTHRNLTLHDPSVKIQISRYHMLVNNVLHISSTAQQPNKIHSHKFPGVIMLQR